VRRRLFNFAAAVSLVLCVAVSLASAVLEVTTFRWAHGLNYYGREHFFALYVANGSARAFISLSPTQRVPSGIWQFLTVDAHSIVGGKLGFRFEKRANLTLVGIPFWLISLSSGCFGWILWKRKRLPRPGLCPTCGYDLRATPARCPECGTVPKEKSRAKAVEPDALARRQKTCLNSFMPAPTDKSKPKRSSTSDKLARTADELFEESKRLRAQADRLRKQAETIRKAIAERDQSPKPH